MTERERDDPLFDLGGLPGGDILFTDPTAASYAEPAPTAAVPPIGASVYQPDPNPTTGVPTPPGASPARPASAPTPPSRWPRPADNATPRRRVGAGPVTRTSRPRGAVRRRRGGRRGAWPLVALLVWAVPAGVHLVLGNGSSSGSSSSSSQAVPLDVSPVHEGDMTYLRPHSVDADSGALTIHIDAPGSGSYTVTEAGVPLEAEVTAAYDLGLGSAATADSLVVASSDDAATIRCEIRNATGEVVATGEATGTLDCAYDPDILLE